MHNIILIYNLNIIDSHFYILLTLKKNLKILLEIKCKLFILKKNYCEALFFFVLMIHLFYSLVFVLNNSIG